MNTEPVKIDPAPTPRASTQPRRPRRWLPWLLACIFIALLVVGFWPRPMPVELAEVTSGPLRSTVSEEGKTRIRQRYVIAAPVSGQLRRVAYKAGDEIRDLNQIVAVIEPVSPTPLDARSRALALARKENALANLDRARAQRHFASNDLVRIERLYQEKTVSTQDFEVAQWREISAAKEELAADAAVRQVEAELADANQQSPGSQTRVEIHARVRGRVLRVMEESERVVNAGTPLMEVGDPADLEAVIEMLSRDGAALSPGTKVELEQWGGSEPLQGRVRLVEPSAFTKISALGVEEQRVNVVVEILTPPNVWNHLGDHFRVEGRVILWESDNTLKAPSGALFRQGKEWAAFVFDGGRARLRTVKVGRSSGLEMQILEGLKAGDRVVLYPGDRLSEGAAIRSIQL